MPRKPTKKGAVEVDGEDTQSVWQDEPAAVYGLEQPVTCPVCRRSVD